MPVISLPFIVIHPWWRPDIPALISVWYSLNAGVKIVHSFLPVSVEAIVTDAPAGAS
jgi:hypothetical protein